MQKREKLKQAAIGPAPKIVLKASIAAGLLAAASSAFAQSNVQLYGEVDEWLGAQQFPSSQRSWQVSGGGMDTSYWGMKGTEDMGGGYKAVFKLESFLRAESGQYGRFQGDTFFARNAYVGVESPYGTVTAGRLTPPLFISTILFNPFVGSYVFSPMIAHVYLGLGTGPSYLTDQGVTGDSGWNNAVQYSTPDFNGMSGNVMYALGNSASQNGAKKWSAQFLYFHGPFAATGVYQYVNFNSAPGDLGSSNPFNPVPFTSQSVGQLGLSYNLKYVKVFGQYMYTYNDRQEASWHVNTVQGGISVPAGPGSILASYAYSRDGGGLDQTRQTWSFGYDYPLSKHTDIYAAFMNDHISGESTGETYGAGIRTTF
ncbi:porin [Pandoraea sp. NE5]|uniref:porin n=1 Tax=Pandoraea sp. NE5 TaxID=2904129 RepID=UPI0021C3F01B|nr:porin [Pandoraea sp. NE5]BDD93180.1 porin [Pandoraea sp. NE5]